MTAGEERLPEGIADRIRAFSDFRAKRCETPDANSRLLRHPKCIVTPHVAAFSCDFEKNFFEYSVRKLEEICRTLASRG